ncbi:LacI family DNA-binding transcriptional regulator [Paenibacillus alba]|uniref:LacI family DNA-binding transcriptional regulator n=1 Tax=Paenibacillus alba TaxID=1197127 RepID=A0ABU6G5Y9_9BACL|nr:LacI family DNA-binding transcriptional regulator [Paenibacillus alba]MEC0229571.1 LacI family DNA-binding transcriptional regulator [Paenibacillus alba]
MTTIYEIAKHAGVSISTVSKALNGYADISPKTRAKIQEIIKELKYQPNATARGLATKRSYMIGAFFQDDLNYGFFHPFLHTLLENFKDAVGRNGYDIVFFTNTVAHGGPDDYEARAKHRNVDGILLLGIHKDDPKLVSLQASSIPIMSIDMDLSGPKVGYVTSDNRGGAIRAVEHLIALGHQRIGFIGDCFSTQVGYERFLGYQQTMQKHGLSVQAEWITQGNFSEESGYTAARDILQLNPCPTAIFCISDSMAIGAMKAVREHGWQVGVDISIVGFDDIAMASHVHPPLTTIRQNKEEMGTRAAMVLVDLIEKDETPSSAFSIPTELIVRESTGAAKP